MRRLAVTGSGRLVPLKGTAYLMIRRLPSHVSQDDSSVTVSFD
jgi:hypothetical protein